ncbi:MAG: hypothetical protein BMS9Abin18_0794 [Zetaproteobacteria bacterium]|nr:MAG: hypothetical protein BMS9Abin18_0794 [Zetaproteobacteria bacterium]
MNRRDNYAGPLFATDSEEKTVAVHTVDRRWVRCGQRNK